MNELGGKVAIVTGGAGGIGRAYATRLAQLGADVAILDIDLDVAKSYGEPIAGADVISDIRALGVSCLGLQVDLTDGNAALAAIGEVAQKLGRIDILVNNAGGAITPFDRSMPSVTPPDDLQRLLDVNFLAMVHCCQAAVDALRRTRGVIVNVATNQTDRLPPDGSNSGYIAAKAAVKSFSQSLALDLARDGVRVNCIAPGIIESARIKAQAAARGIGSRRQAEANPMRRLGTPADCVGVLQFLVTDLSAYVTGECIRVSGGSALTSGA